jgi:hypothetical protein
MLARTEKIAFVFINASSSRGREGVRSYQKPGLARGHFAWARFGSFKRDAIPLKRLILLA